MVSKNAKIVAYIVIAVLIGLIAVTGLSGTQNKNSVIVNGVEFISDNSSPVSHLPQITEEQEFVVGVEMHDPAGPGEEAMLNASLLFVVVLNYNQRQAVQLVKVLDYENNTTYCLTNHGDVLTEETLSVDECRAMLQDTKKAVVMVKLPNQGLANPQVHLSGKTIQVESNSLATVGKTSFTVLRTMFENAEEALIKSNNITSLLG